MTFTENFFARFLVAMTIILVADSIPAGQLAGQVIDFESTPAGTGPIDNSPLSHSEAYVIDGIAVTFGFDSDDNGVTDTDAVFERRGNEADNGFFSVFGPEAFDTERNSSPHSLGQFFLRQPDSIGAVPGPLLISYGMDVEAFSGQIWDIDAGDTGFEQWRVSAFDASGNMVATVDSPAGIDTNDPDSMDSLAWVFSVQGGNIRTVRMEFIGSNPIVGLAFDNYSATTGVLLGDVNLDGAVNLLDVAPFVDRVISGTFQIEADINQDGLVSLLDVGPFVALLVG